MERSDSEVLDALPVLVPERESTRLPAPRSVAPMVQTAAVAAGGFVAGAVVVGVLGRRHRGALAGRVPRRLARRGRPSRGRPKRELVEIVGSRSLLVDVHLLGSLPSPARSR